MRDINKDQFATEVEQAEGVVAVKFYSTTCGPCKMVSAQLPAVEAEIGMEVLKLNVEDNMEVADKYGVMRVPVILVFKDGKQVDRLDGFKPKEEIVQTILKHK